jgi:hypothetical protein
VRSHCPRASLVLAALAIAVAGLGVVVGCEERPEEARVSGSGPAPASGELRVELDERPVIVGEVLEELPTREGYVYLRLSVLRTSADPGLAPRSVQRWVALDGAPPELGETLRLRSLGRRSRVWDPEIERDFEVLEYVARI